MHAGRRVTRALLESRGLGTWHGRVDDDTRGRDEWRTATASRLVWDLPLRATHWLLALTVAGAWVTHYAGTSWFAWHRALGYATLVLVVFRIVWGFVGTRHARFAVFVRGPGAVLDYLRSRPLPRHAGPQSARGPERASRCWRCCCCRRRPGCSPTTRSRMPVRSTAGSRRARATASPACTRRIRTCCWSCSCCTWPRSRGTRAWSAGRWCGR